MTDGILGVRSSSTKGTPRPHRTPCVCLPGPVSWLMTGHCHKDIQVDVSFSDVPAQRWPVGDICSAVASRLPSAPLRWGGPTVCGGGVARPRFSQLWGGTKPKHNQKKEATFFPNQK